MATTISTLGPVPSTASPLTFDSDADNFLGKLPQFRTELNAMGVEVEGSRNTATTAATTATAAAQAAQASATAANTTGPAWVSGTTYALGNVVYSPANFQSYRRKVAGAGTTDPSLDGTNWVNITGLFKNITTVQTAAFTAVIGAEHPVNTTAGAFNITCPAGPLAGNSFVLFDYLGTWDVNPPILVYNGTNKIMVTSTNAGTSNQSLNIRNKHLTVTYIDATKGWRFS